MGIALRTRLCTPGSNYAAKQPFAALKNNPRSTTEENEPDSLSTLYIGSEIMQSADHNEIVRYFTVKKIAYHVNMSSYKFLKIIIFRKFFSLTTNLFVHF